MSRRKCFFLGQASGLVEPIAEVLWALFVPRKQNILPCALCFAAGAMIFVVVEELTPESQRKQVSIELRHHGHHDRVCDHDDSRCRLGLISIC
jgi:ZIP family zinc transporter